MDNKVILYIPARKNSKGIKGKNKKDFCGKPLIAWSIETALQSEKITHIVIGTDDEEIQDLVKTDYPDVLIHDRSNSLYIDDKSSSEKVILEYLEMNSYNENDCFIMRQCTSPLVLTEHLDEAIELYIKNKSSVLSVSDTHRFYWWFQVNKYNSNYNVLNRPRIQDFNTSDNYVPYYVENGAFYINSVKKILKNKCRICNNTLPYIMPEWTQFEIDSIDDWLVCEELFKKYVLKSEIKEFDLFVCDFDGTFSTGEMFFDKTGKIMKLYNTKDACALVELNKMKKVIFLSGESNVSKTIAETLGIEFYGGIHKKKEFLFDYCKKNSYNLNRVAYIGDDINDFICLNMVGLKACPGNSADKVKSINNIYICQSNGGEGAVREFIDYIYPDWVKWGEND